MRGAEGRPDPKVKGHGTDAVRGAALRTDPATQMTFGTGSAAATTVTVGGTVHRGTTDLQGTEEGERVGEGAMLNTEERGRPGTRGRTTRHHPKKVSDPTFLKAIFRYIFN